jgi:hypothetical protein
MEGGRDQLLLLRERIRALLGFLDSLLGLPSSEADVDEISPAKAREKEVLARMSELREEGLKTNDLVVLEGSPAPGSIRQLRVNGSEPIKLSRREYLAALVLCLHRLGRLPSGSDPDLPFLAAFDLLAEVESLRPWMGEDSRFWKYPVPQDIHRSIRDMRAKLETAKLNPALFGTGPRPSGYRLATLARNVVVRGFSLDGPPPLPAA